MRNILTRKHILISLVSVASILSGSIAWHVLAKTNAQPASTEEATPVHTVSVSPSSIQPTEVFSGFVRGILQANISPKTSGYIISLLKEPGEYVHSGDLLAMLDGNELIAGNQSAARSLAAALTLLERTEKYTKQQVDAAETALSKVKDDRNRGTATDKDVRVAEDAVRTTKKSRDTQNAQAAASVAAIQGSESLTKTALENRFIRAPFSGIITGKPMSVGTFVNPGTTLYTLLSPNDLEIPISVPLRLVHSLQKGTSVSIVPEHSGQHLSGEVFSIAPAVNPATGEAVAIIRFHIDEQTSLSDILPGEYASVEFPTSPKKEVLLVPNSAVLRQYGETFVFTVTDSQAHKQPITLGSHYGDLQEILSGLSAGDTVVVEGVHTLQEGTKVHDIHHE